MYFGKTILHVSGSFPAHHQELSTVQLALAILCRFDDLLLQVRGRQTSRKCANVKSTQNVPVSAVQ
jgi:hypothetical protein